MPDIRLRPVLQDCVDDVLEKMFFVRCLGELAEECDEPEMAARVGFEGEPSGALTLRVSSTVARSVAADFLSEYEAELSDRQVEEVLCELTNMICGSVLSRVESASTFRLSVPRLLPAGEIEAEGELKPVTYTAALENGRLTVIFQTEAPVCPTAEKSAC